MKIPLLALTGTFLSLCLTIAGTAPEATAMGVTATTDCLAACCPCPEWLCPDWLCRLLGCCTPPECCTPAQCCTVATSCCGG